MKNLELNPEIMNKLKQDVAKSLELSKRRRAIAEEVKRLDKQYGTKKIKFKQ